MVVIFYGSAELSMEMTWEGQILNCFSAGMRSLNSRISDAAHQFLNQIIFNFTTVKQNDASDLSVAPPKKIVIILQAFPATIYCKSSSQFYVRLKKTFKSKQFILLSDN